MPRVTSWPAHARSTVDRLTESCDTTAASDLPVCRPSSWVASKVTMRGSAVPCSVSGAQSDGQVSSQRRTVSLHHKKFTGGGAQC